MAIQYKVSNEGVVYDVKMIAEPKPRRNYNRNYYYAKKKQEIVQVQLLREIDHNPIRNGKALNDEEMLKGSSVEK